MPLAHYRLILLLSGWLANLSSVDQIMGAHGCVIVRWREQAKNTNIGNQIEAEERDALTALQTEARQSLQHH